MSTYTAPTKCSWSTTSMSPSSTELLMTYTQVCTMAIWYPALVWPFLCPTTASVINSSRKSIIGIQLLTILRMIITLLWRLFGKLRGGLRLFLSGHLLTRLICRLERGIALIWRPNSGKLRGMVLEFFKWLTVSTCWKDMGGISRVSWQLW